MSHILPFVELEFVHAIGPDAGRYVVAIDGAAPAAPPLLAQAGAVPDHDPDAEIEAGGREDVLQIKIVEGTTTSRGLRRRTKDVSGAEKTADVPVLRVMWIGASQPADSKRVAAERLERLRTAEDEREELVEAILDVLNTAVRAHRAASRDPYLPEVTRADPRAVRFGYGEARPLTQGKWTEAFLAPPPRVQDLDRAVRLGPSETVALALRGRLDLLESEELVLRALLDIDQRRWRSGAVQLTAATRLLRAELDGARERDIEIATDDDDLERRADRIAALGALALADELDDVAQSELRGHADALADVLEGWRIPK